MESFLNLTPETRFSEQEAFEMMDIILDEKLDQETAVQLLKTIHERGETIDELTGFLRAIMLQSVPINIDPQLNIIDTCGTGGDGLNTINISTGSALLLASMGLNVTKHGGRAATGKVGSADIVEALGIPFAKNEKEVSDQLSKNHFSFLFAPDFNPRLKNMAAIRRALSALGSRSCFNILAPLANPVKPAFQIIGVYSQELLEKLAELVLKLNDRTVLLVCGEGKMDEISITGHTSSVMVSMGDKSCLVIKPEDMDIVKYNFDEVMKKLSTGNSLAEKTFVFREALSTTQNPLNDIICANAAAVLWIMGKADSLAHGMQLAREASTQQKAIKLIDKIAAGK
jgi:anthranilate phosphoribosyltransferase